MGQLGRVSQSRPDVTESVSGPSVGSVCSLFLGYVLLRLKGRCSRGKPLCTKAVLLLIGRLAKASICQSESHGQAQHRGWNSILCLL